MLQRMVHLLLVAALSSSGASAPFLHVHAHGPGYGASSHGGSVDEHCAHHHAEGAHWHLPGNPASDAGGALADGHGHAAISLSAVAIETPPTDAGAPSVPWDAPENGVASRPAGPRVPVPADAGPDPPPLPLPATRGPPARS